MMSYKDESNSNQVRRVAIVDLTRKLTESQKIVLGHLTYSASKLWNVANYAFREENIPLKELKSKLKDSFWCELLRPYRRSF